MAEIPVIDVENELEKKVALEVARIRIRERYGLGKDQEETLRSLLYAGIGRQMLNNYKEEGVNVRGRSYLRRKISYSEALLGEREGLISSGSIWDMPQIQNARETEAMNRNGDYLGGSIRDASNGQTEEDFRFGVPPQGGSYLQRNVFGFNAGKAKMLAKQKYDPTGRNAEEMFRTVPRKYKIENQTYVLDVQATLEGASINTMTAGYMQLRVLLESERDNSDERDRLMKKYSEIELEHLKGDTVEERDD